MADEATIRIEVEDGGGQAVTPQQAQAAAPATTGVSAAPTPPPAAPAAASDKSLESVSNLVKEIDSLIGKPKADAPFMFTPPRGAGPSGIGEQVAVRAVRAGAVGEATAAGGARAAAGKVAAGVAKGGAAAGGAVTAGLAALGPPGIALAAALVTLTVGLKLLGAATKSASEGIDQWSTDIAAASADVGRIRMQGEMTRAAIIGDEIAEGAVQGERLTQAFKELQALIIEPLLAVKNVVVGLMANSIEGMATVLGEVRALLVEMFKWFTESMGAILEWIPGASQVLGELKGLTKEILDWAKGGDAAESDLDKAIDTFFGVTEARKARKAPKGAGI